MKPLLFESFGGPEVLQYRDLPDPAVPPVHVQLAMRAIGVNFGDLHRWRGVTSFLASHHTSMVMKAGIVVAVGEAVDEMEIGDRAAAAGPAAQSPGFGLQRRQDWVASDFENGLARP